MKGWEDVTYETYITGAHAFCPSTCQISYPDCVRYLRLSSSCLPAPNW